MGNYTLFLDESYTYSSNGNDQAFAIGGFIVNDKNIEHISNRVSDLKNNIWGDLPDPKSIILHELDIKDALINRCPINKLNPNYVRFRNDSHYTKKLYSEMSKIIKDSDIVTLGCVIIQDCFMASFPKDLQNEISLVSMQIIIENYTHFLFKNIYLYSTIMLAMILRAQSLWRIARMRITFIT